MDDDEQLVAEFLQGKGLRAEEFSKEEKTRSKTPDFRVFKGNTLVFYCEVKTVSRDEWLDKQLAVAPPGTVVGGARNDPVFNRISTKIHEAVQQLGAVNSDLEYPNVLVLVNRHDGCDVGDLQDVLSGDFVAEDGSRHPIYREFSEGRIREEKLRIHYYIWMERAIEPKQEYYRFFRSSSKHLTALRGLFDLGARP